MYNKSSIAVGTKVFNRTEKLENLLESVPEFVDSVYIADDGNTDSRTDIYNREYSFKLQLIDLEYDVGLGYGRAKIVDNLTEDYLLIVDTDHVIPEESWRLIDVLDECPGYGGISGVIAEYGDITGLFQNLRVENNILIRFRPNNLSTQIVAGTKYKQFDFIPNAALFRANCLKDYSWDPEYVIGYEHIDFYVGHMYTDWSFAMTPDVVFDHYPGGSSDYTSHRDNPTKLLRSKQYFLNKWDFREVISHGSYMKNIKPAGLRSYVPVENLPVRIEAEIERLNDFIWLLKWKLLHTYSSWTSKIDRLNDN